MVAEGKNNVSRERNFLYRHISMGTEWYLLISLGVLHYSVFEKQKTMQENKMKEYNKRSWIFKKE